MLSKEEKEAIDYFRKEVEEKQWIESNFNITERNNLRKLLKIIEKQQKDIEKKEKIIDLMIKELSNQYNDYEPCYLDDKMECKKYKDCKECIKQYFEKKVEK